MKRYFWLVAIFVLALTLRIIGLAKYPMGFTPDEAAFGYNAYSLIQTGRDEWGVPFYKLPLTNLESFGDYKLPLYAFLAVPTVKIFGLNEFATRLPNAVFGSLGVFSIFALAYYLTPFPSPKLRRGVRGEVGLLAAFLFAVSPWSIQLSRGAFEANLVTLLLPLFLALFLSQKYLFASLILAINFYSYHSARFISLLLILFFLIKSKSYRLLLVLLVMPGMLSLLGAGNRRAADVSILSPTDNWRSVADARFSAVQSGLPDFFARLVYNKATSVLSQFTQNYVTYFSPQFLFTQGPKETTYGMFPGIGVMYPIEAILLIAAIYYLIKYSNRLDIGFWILFILAAASAALSKGPGYAANRAAPMLPFLILLSVLGFFYISKYIPKILLILFYSSALLLFLITYIYHARDLASGMLYGRREAIIRSSTLDDNIYISTSVSEPHIYVAFYNQVDPQSYQTNSQNWQVYHNKNLKFLDQLDSYALDKYTFGHLKFNHPGLYLGLPQEFPNSIKPMFTIDFPDGTKAIQVSRL